jgi:hypothetical protein
VAGGGGRSRWVAGGRVMVCLCSGVIDGVRGCVAVLRVRSGFAWKLYCESNVTVENIFGFF